MNPYLEGLILLMRIALESGGVKKLNAFFTRHAEELMEMKAALHPPGKSKGYA